MNAVRIIGIILTGLATALFAYIMLGLGVALLQPDDPMVKFDFIDQNTTLGVATIAVAAMIVLNWIIFVFTQRLRLFVMIGGGSLLCFFFVLWLLFFQ